MYEKEHFRVEISTGFTGVPPFFVTIYRTVPDFCRANLPDGVELIFDFKELGLDPGTELLILNPIGNKLRVLSSIDIPNPIPQLPKFINPQPFPWPWPNPDPIWPPHPWRHWDSGRTRIEGQL